MSRRESTRAIRRAAGELCRLEAELSARRLSSDPFAERMADFTRKRREAAEAELERRRVGSQASQGPGLFGGES